MSDRTYYSTPKDLEFFCGNGQWKNSTTFNTNMGVSFPTETKVLEVTGRGRVLGARLNFYRATDGYGFSAGDKLKIVVDDDDANIYEWKVNADYVNSSSGTPMGVQTTSVSYTGYGDAAIKTPHIKSTNSPPYENWFILGTPIYTKNFKVYIVRKQRAGEAQNIACTVEYTKDND